MLVTTTYTSDSRVRRAAEALADEGHDVHVLCCYSRGYPMRHERIRGVQVHRVARETRDVPGAVMARFRRFVQRSREDSRDPARLSSSRQRLGPRSMTLLRAVASPALFVHRRTQARRLAVAMARLNPDIVHANDPDTLPAVSRAVANGVRLVYDTHELTSGRADLFAWERWIDLWYERRWIPKADIVITVSPGIADVLERRHGRRLIVVRNVPLPPADPRPPFDLRSRIGVTGGRIVLHQGVRAPGRGLPYLIEAMAHVPDAHLVLLGSAARGMDHALRQAAVSKGVHDRVHFLEPVPSDQLLTVTAQADVGIALIENISESFRLSLPNKLFEYLVSGIPAVASDLPEMRRVIEQCDGGVLCDPRSPQSIAQALGRDLDKPDTHRLPTALTELDRLVEAYARLGSQA